MPHIILEHSANLAGIDYKNLFSAIYQFMAKIPNIGTCKMRAICHQYYYIGTENEENAFASVRVLMAPKTERTDQFREIIAEGLIPIISQYLDPVKKKLNIKCYPTLEMGILSKQYYWIEDKF